MDYINDTLGQNTYKFLLFFSVALFITNMTSIGLWHHNCKFGFSWSLLFLELLVPLCTREENVHPNPHSFWAWSHQIILPIVRLHAECDPLRDRLCILMVHIHLGYRVEVDSSFGFVLREKWIHLNFYLVRQLNLVWVPHLSTLI